MSRVGYVVKEYWFELLMGLMLLAGIVQLTVLDEEPGAPTTTFWFCVPALVLVVLPLFARRRFPFAAPAAYFTILALGQS